MKRLAAAFAVITLLFLVSGAGPAVARHKEGHQRPPSCDDHPTKPKPQNKHCYPPRSSSQSSNGQNASFATDAPESAGGLTVGMATITAVGALGALLIARRRWVFRTPRR